MDPNDVRFHRTYINEYDPWRQSNNFVMHPLDLFKNKSKYKWYYAILT